VPFLVIGSSNPPTSHCCDGAKVAFQRANNAQAIKNLSCLVDVGPYLNFGFDNLARLPEACSIRLSFSIDRDVQLFSFFFHFL